MLKNRQYLFKIYSLYVILALMVSKSLPPPLMPECACPPEKFPVSYILLDILFIVKNLHVKDLIQYFSSYCLKFHTEISCLPTYTINSLKAITMSQVSFIFCPQLTLTYYQVVGSFHEFKLPSNSQIAHAKSSHNREI